MLLISIMLLIPRDIRTFIGNKNITTNIFRIQAYDSIMCDYFCKGFIDFMLAGKKLTDYTNLFSPHNFKKNDDKFWLISNMNECNSFENNSINAIDKTSLTE